ncbi:MAG: RNA methyltransferase [Roseiflexaceae bacterium]
MHSPDLFDNIIVVLYQPQKLANIGGAVRALKNMGLRRLRLVRPAEYDPAVIVGIAHRSADLLAATTIHDDLDDALADAVFVVGATARAREAAARVSTPRALAPELLARAAAGPVALLFGPEDHGLTNAELDRCHVLLCIPADPAYSSLNLAQAVLIAAYEIRMAADLPPSAPRHQPNSPANVAQLEALFDAMEQALWGIDFFKFQQAEIMLRTLRGLIHRAEPDAREVALLKAICLETLAFLRRKGIEPGTAPGDKVTG